MNSPHFSFGKPVNYGHFKLTCAIDDHEGSNHSFHVLAESIPRVSMSSFELRCEAQSSMRFGIEQFDVFWTSFLSIMVVTWCSSQISQCNTMVFLASIDAALDLPSTPLAACGCFCWSFCCAGVCGWHWLVYGNYCCSTVVPITWAELVVAIRFISAPFVMATAFLFYVEYIVLLLANHPKLSWKRIESAIWVFEEKVTWI